MPRRRPDVVHEYRVSLSDYERSTLNEIVTTQQANVAVDGITATLQAAGSALAGGGLMLAAVVLMRWKGPELIPTILNKTNETLDSIADTFLPGSPVEARRTAQAFAERRGEIAKREATYCSRDSAQYSETECSTTQQMKDQYFADLEAFRAMVREQYGDAPIVDLIYRGLGDINPGFVA